jgi:hypothetical protein
MRISFFVHNNPDNMRDTEPPMLGPAEGFEGTRITTLSFVCTIPSKNVE